MPAANIYKAVIVWAQVLMYTLLITPPQAALIAAHITAMALVWF